MSNDEQTEISISSFPRSFLTFLSDNNIDPSIYSVTNLPRYIRFNTRFEDALLPTVQELREQLNTQIIWKVPGLSSFYGIEFQEESKRLIDCQAYKEGKIFGIDLSSGIAVAALDIQPDDHVLDLCCAPGAKLCMISNLLTETGLGSVTGVDIAFHRACTCKSLVKRYKIGGRVRLFVADGVNFNVFAPSSIKEIIRKKKHKLIAEAGDILNSEEENVNMEVQSAKDVPYIKPFWASKMLQHDPQCHGSEYLYDKVIVDAECTHDGSIVHILKYKKWGWDAFEKNFLDPNRINNITQLQRDLLTNAWRLLKPGGLLVYSTCSLSVKQNEENIAWFMLQNLGAASIEEVPVKKLNIKMAEIKKVSSLRNEIKVEMDLMKEIETKCLRFDPTVSATSGFFVARIRKHQELI